MYKHILLTIDLTDEASWRNALPVAVEYCRKFGSVLHVLTVVPDFGMSPVAQYFPEGYADKAVEDAKAGLHELTAKQVPDEVKVQHIVAYGRIYDEILATAKKIDADLIVMASHRPELGDYLIGPNASRVARHADRSVLVVRGNK